jgi:hypothetical protein
VLYKFKTDITMKTTTIPKDREKAIASGKIEFATVEGSTSRSHLIQFINIVRGLEARGLEIPSEISLDYESLIAEVERRGITIPSKPFTSLSKREQRSFSDSLSGVTIPSITDNMTPRQKELYAEHLHYKNNDKRDIHGNWIVSKKQ